MEKEYGISGEKMFRELFDNMDESVVVYDVKNNGKEIIIKDMNKSAEKLERVKKENVIGKRVDIVFKGVKEIGLYNIFEKVWKTGKPIKHPLSFYKDKYHQGWRENFVFKLPSGEVVAIYSDVTKEKEAELSLKIKDLIFNESQASNSIADLNGIIQDVNNSFLNITGFSSKKEVIGKSVSYFFKNKKESDNFLEVLRNRRKWRGEITARKKDGTLFQVYGSATLLLDENGKTIGYQSSMYDITERKKAEEELKNNQVHLEQIVKERTSEFSMQRDYLNAILANLADPVVIKDENHKWILVNDAACKFFGYSREEMIGKNNFDLFSDKEARVFQETDNKILKRGGETRKEEFITGKNGITYTVIAKKTLFNFSDNQKNIITIIRDITDLKKKEEEMQRQKAFLSSVLENVPDMIFVKDSKNLKFELFNKAGEELLGYKREQLLGKSDYDFFPKKQAKFFIQKDRAVLKNKELLDISEEPIDTKRGKRYLHTKKIPIFENGKPLYLMGISEDITEKRKAEIEYKTMLDTMLDGFAVVTDSGKFLEVNDSYCKMLGYSRDELLKLDLNFIDVKHDFKQVEEHLKEVMVVGSGKFETSHKGKNGKIFDVELIVTYLESSHKLFVFVHDVTERKTHERELAIRTAELERFNNAAIGRELKMIELKKKISKLEREK